MIALALLCALAQADVLLDLEFGGGGGGMVPGGAPTMWTHGDIPTTMPHPDGISQVWGARLAGLYFHNASSHLTLPSAALASTDRLVLSLDHWHDIHSPDDVALVEICFSPPCGEEDWVATPPIYGWPDPAVEGLTGISGGWRQHHWEVTGITSADQLRLHLLTDGSLASRGWLLAGARITDGDAVPPDISALSIPADTDDLVGPHPVAATVVDDLGLTGVTLSWQVGGGPVSSVDMTEGASNRWSGSIPGMAPGQVELWIEASDGTNEASSSVESFAIQLPAPTDLICPTGRQIAPTATLAWSPPGTSEAVFAYRVHRDGELVAEVVPTTAEVPLVGPLDTFTVAALYDTIHGSVVGEASDSCEVEAAVPELLSLDPAEAWQGDTLRLTVHGHNLVMVEGEVTLDLGEDITQVDLEVQDVNTSRITLEIGEDATVGARDGWLLSGELELDLPGIFTILDGADRPAITSIEPDAVPQGSQQTALIETNHAIVGMPEVTMGPGVIILDVVLIEGDEGSSVEVELIVAADAPLGTREVILDDGIYLLSGATLRVRDADSSPQASCGCQAHPSPAPWTLLGMAGLLALAGIRRSESPR